jgi:hypothetical protein
MANRDSQTGQFEGLPQPKMPKTGLRPKTEQVEDLSGLMGVSGTSNRNWGKRRQNMSNPNIAAEARKGGKARWKGISKKKRTEAAKKAAWIRWARMKDLDKARNNEI